MVLRDLVFIAATIISLLVVVPVIATQPEPYCQGVCGLGSEVDYEQLMPFSDIPDPIYTRDVVGSQNPEVGSVFINIPVEPGLGSDRNRDLGIIGDTSDWRKYRERVYPFTAMGQIWFIEGGIAYVCSGTLVGRNLVLTSAHCALNGGDGNLLEDIRFYPNKVDGVSFHRTMAMGGLAFFGEDAYRYGSRYRPQRDWVLLFLERNIGDIYGWLQLADSLLPYSSPNNEINDEVKVNINVTVYGYAIHEFCEQTKNLCAGTGGVKIGKLGENTIEYRYEIDTSSGTSGGAITAALGGNVDGWDPFTIYGIHKGQASPSYNVGVPSTLFYKYTSEFLTSLNYTMGMKQVYGIVCHEHSHCTDYGTLFCSRASTCTRCDLCSESEDSDMNYIPVSTSESEVVTCPDYCLLEDKDANCLEQFQDPSVASATSNSDNNNVICLWDFPCLCFDLTCSGVKIMNDIQNANLKSDFPIYPRLDSECLIEAPAVIRAGESSSDKQNICIKPTAADLLQVSESLLNSFGGNANALSAQVGFAAGIVVNINPNRDNLYDIIGFPGSNVNTATTPHQYNVSCADVDGRIQILEHFVTPRYPTAIPTFSPTQSPTFSPTYSPSFPSFSPTDGPTVGIPPISFGPPTTSGSDDNNGNGDDDGGDTSKSSKFNLSLADIQKISIVGVACACFLLAIITTIKLFRTTKAVSRPKTEYHNRKFDALPPKYKHTHPHTQEKGKSASLQTERETKTQPKRAIVNVRDYYAPYL